MTKFLEAVNGFVWGIPALVLILGVGLYLSIRTGFAQLRLFPRALRAFAGNLSGKQQVKGVSSFQALCTALAATVGTGNIAGVAGAIAIGGPGSIFWMWMCAILGMITKYAEAFLAVYYRVANRDGTVSAGPMYVISRGMGKRWKSLATCYCLFGVVAAFGIGNATQINAVTDSFRTAAAGYENNRAVALLIGVTMAVLCAGSLLGGVKRIAKISVLLVPAASCAYLTLGLGALISNMERIPGALEDILCGAFCPEAVTGGMLGSAFLALRTGASRGVFTNEAGMGTAGIAHGASAGVTPGEQGLMGIMEVFLDTVVICTMTALVILTSGTPIRYGFDEGVALTVRAFACTYGSWIAIPMCVFLACFAFATMLGWGLYGVSCARYLFGEKAWKPFVLLQAGAAVAGVLLRTETVWLLSDTVNGLMAIPNLIALAALSPLVIRSTKRAPEGALFRKSGRTGGPDTARLRCGSSAEGPRNPALPAAASGRCCR